MSDRQVQEQLNLIREATKEATSSKEAALETLRKAGIVTQAGRLSKSFSPNPT